MVMRGLLSKSRQFVSPLFFTQPQFLQTPVKRGFFQAGLRQNLRNRHFTVLPPYYHVSKVFGGLFDKAAKANALCLRRRNALGLTLFDTLTLALRHEGQNLQHQIGMNIPFKIFGRTSSGRYLSRVSLRLAPLPVCATDFVFSHNSALVCQY